MLPETGHRFPSRLGWAEARPRLSEPGDFLGTDDGCPHPSRPGPPLGSERLRPSGHLPCVSLLQGPAGFSPLSRPAPGPAGVILTACVLSSLSVAHEPQVICSSPRSGCEWPVPTLGRVPRARAGLLFDTQRTVASSTSLSTAHPVPPWRGSFSAVPWALVVLTNGGVFCQVSLSWLIIKPLCRQTYYCVSDSLAGKS